MLDNLKVNNVPTVVLDSSATSELVHSGLSRTTLYRKKKRYNIIISSLFFADSILLLNMICT